MHPNRRLSLALLASLALASPAIRATLAGNLDVAGAVLRWLVAFVLARAAINALANLYESYRSALDAAEAEAIAGAREVELEERATFGRRGVAPRSSGEFGIHAVRTGGNPGEHVVILADDGEEIRFAHRAFGRRAYARGALRAAAFVVGRDPGFYTPADLAPV